MKNPPEPGAVVARPYRKLGGHRSTRYDPCAEWTRAPLRHLYGAGATWAYITWFRSELCPASSWCSDGQHYTEKLCQLYHAAIMSHVNSVSLLCAKQKPSGTTSIDKHRQLQASVAVTLFFDSGRGPTSLYYLARSRLVGRLRAALEMYIIISKVTGI